MLKNNSIVYIPFEFKIAETMVNSETVWYANKWKNLFLKIKHFFFKPKCYNNSNIYKKRINFSYYKPINSLNN
jgi:hypothetical protein